MKRKPGTATTAATAWLADALKDGPCAGTELKAKARETQISIGTLYAAAKALSVLIESTGDVTAAKTWSLPQ